jgi:hypothetical protein
MIAKMWELAGLFVDEKAWKDICELT